MERLCLYKGNLPTTKLSRKHADNSEQIEMAFKNLVHNTTCA